VLFLLLISGEALKWAQLTTNQLNGMGILQLILTGCVGFAVAIWMIMNPRKVYKSITVMLSACWSTSPVESAHACKFFYQTCMHMPPLIWHQRHWLSSSRAEVPQSKVAPHVRTLLTRGCGSAEQGGHG